MYTIYNIHVAVYMWPDYLSCDGTLYSSDEVKEAMKNMDVEREDYQDNLEQLKDFLEAQKVDMDGLKSKVLDYLL